MLQQTTLPGRAMDHPSTEGATGMSKRILDASLAAIGLLLLAPILLAIAVAIKLDSPGPVFYKQRRVGKNGRTFWMYKFRSMVLGAEQQLEGLRTRNEVKDGITFKMREDPRVTRLGRWLRKTSLDEFPQLINVLHGDMSLVGPRPPLPSEVARYRPEHLRRLSVTPGCTGLWQVSGRSDIDTFGRMVELDLAYIDTWSLWQDLRILAKTVRVVLTMKGAR